MTALSNYSDSLFKLTRRLIQIPDKNIFTMIAYLCLSVRLLKISSELNYIPVASTDLLIFNKTTAS